MVQSITHTQPSYGHYTGSTHELENFIGAKFYRPHALAVSN